MSVLKKSVACVLGLVTFLFGLLVVLPAGLVFILGRMGLDELPDSGV